MRLGILADLHLGHGDDERVLSELRRAREWLLGEFGAERLVVLGDLIVEASPEEDAERIERLREALEEPDVPVRYVRGNHDVGTLSNGDLTALFGQPPCGADRTDAGRLLYLNSAAPHLGGARGEVGSDGRDFLRRSLASEPAALLFSHHPLCLPDLSGNPWFESFPERAVAGDRKEVGAVLDETAGVDAVFSGHLHEPHHREREGTDHVVLGAFNRARPGGGCPGTHAAAEVREDRIEVTERAEGTVQRRLTIGR